MANNEHLEKLIFEVHGAEKGAELIEKLREQEDKYAKSLKGLKKEAKERAKAEEEAARKVVAAKEKERKAEEEAAKARAAAMGNMKAAALGLAAGLAAAVKVGADMVQTYARVDAANGRLAFALKQTGMAAGTVNVAMREARSQFKEWEQFGVSAEQQAESLRALVTESGNYEQSLKDVRLAIDIHNASGWDMQRATEAIRKARQGEVEVLKELGILTKDEAEELGKVDNQAARAAQAINKLSAAFAGGGEGTAGLEQSLNAANVKLEDTQRIIGELISEIGGEGVGLISSMAEFLGVIDEGEHPLDALNARLETLLNHAKDGNWEKLSGGLLIAAGAASANPSLISTGVGMLGVSSADVTSRTDTARGRQELTEEAIAMAGFSGAGNQVNEVPEPDAVSTSGGKKKPKGGRRRAASGGPSGFEGDFVGGSVQTLDEAVAPMQIEAWRLAQEEKTRILEEETQKRIEAEDAYFARMFESIKESERLTEEQKQLDQAKVAAAVDGLATIGNAMAEYDESGKAALAMNAVTAAAQAAIALGLALMPGPPGGPQYMPGAITTMAAAAAAAAKAGVGITKPGRVSGKRQQGSRGGLSSDRERVSLMNEQSRSRESRASQTHVVNIYSTFGPSPQQSRELVDAVEREMRNRTTVRRM